MDDWDAGILSWCRCQNEPFTRVTRSRDNLGAGIGDGQGAQSRWVDVSGSGRASVPSFLQSVYLGANIDNPGPSGYPLPS